MPLHAQDAQIAFICPTYNKFLYAHIACRSFLKYTERPCMIIHVDDASPYWGKQDWDAWHKGIPQDRIVSHRFSENHGLTRSWNFGLKMARDMGIKYAICGNSDIRFTPGWEQALIHQVRDNGYHLIAPVSNAPGVTNAGRQRVHNYFPGYRVTDDPEYNKQVAEYLQQHYPPTTVVGTVSVNGFFMFAKTDTWWGGCYDKDHVFNPKNRMTKNEDELQGRWQRKGWRTGFTPASFIFHYRAVSRGDQFRHKGWFRLDPANAPQI